MADENQTFRPVPRFDRDVVIYVPAYNCANTIVETIRSVPPELLARADVLVVDNNSNDHTSDVVITARNEGVLPRSLQLIRTSKNIGYAGSQKLAFSLVRSSVEVRWVIMLHGDGQYPSELLSKLVPLFGSDLSLVYGYRSKMSYRQLEETPIPTWAAIKLLSALESVVTGYVRKEWHTGFNMYSVNFLKRLPLSEMTDTSHIDGQISFLAGALGAPVHSVPIYKRYKGFEAFGGTGRVKYVFHVLWLMFEFRLKWRSFPERPAEDTDFLPEYVLRS